MFGERGEKFEFVALIHLRVTLVKMENQRRQKDGALVTYWEGQKMVIWLNIVRLKTPTLFVKCLSKYMGLYQYKNMVPVNYPFLETLDPIKPLGSLAILLETVRKSYYIERFAVCY